MFAFYPLRPVLTMPVRILSCSLQAETCRRDGSPQNMYRPPLLHCKSVPSLSPLLPASSLSPPSLCSLNFSLSVSPVVLGNGSRRLTHFSIGLYLQGERKGRRVHWSFSHGFDLSITISSPVCASISTVLLCGLCAGYSEGIGISTALPSA